MVQLESLTGLLSSYLEQDSHNSLSTLENRLNVWGGGGLGGERDSELYFCN